MSVRIRIKGSDYENLGLKTKDVKAYFGPGLRSASLCEAHIEFPEVLSIDVTADAPIDEMPFSPIELSEVAEAMLDRLIALGVIDMNKTLSDYKPPLELIWE